jgi:hypothetical protein
MDTNSKFIIMNKIIVLSGNKGVGKDTVANFMQDMFHYTLCKTFAFAKPIKEITSILLDTSLDILDDNKDRSVHEIGITDVSKSMTPRNYYTTIGDMFCKTFGKEVFAKIILKQIEESNFEFNIITDMRFRHEYNLLKELKPIFIRVKSNRVKLDTTHYSETDLLYLSDDAFDYVIDNSGTIRDLFLRVKGIAEDIKQKSAL